MYHLCFANGSRTGEVPADMRDRKLRVKLRDGFRCVQCGSRTDLRGHHKKGMKSHRLKDLEVLCFGCHQKAHGFQVREPKVI